MGKEKVENESILKSFKITNLEVFKQYLKEVWLDLTFSSYYQLKGIISLFLFIVFDKNNKGYIKIKEFLNRMITLFYDNFEKNSKFILIFTIMKKWFNFKRVLSYVTLNKNDTNSIMMKIIIQATKIMKKIITKIILVMKIIKITIQIK